MILANLTRFALQLPVVGKIIWRSGLTRSLRRYFATKDFGRFHIKFGENIKIWVSLSENIEAQILWQGVQSGDRGEVLVLKSVLKPHDVFIDVGANVGVFSLLAARQMNNKGQIHAFEPLSMHIQKLNENLRLNGFTIVEVNHKALSRSIAECKLYLPPEHGVETNTGLASIYPSPSTDPRFELISTTKLDNYVQTKGLTRIDLIKLDVEGAELDVLEGGRNSIERFRPSVMMEINKKKLQLAGVRFPDIMSFWAGMSYLVYLISHDGKLIKISDEDSLGLRQNIFCSPNGALKL